MLASVPLPENGNNCLSVRYCKYSAKLQQTGNPTDALMHGGDGPGGIPSYIRTRWQVKPNEPGGQDHLFSQKHSFPTHPQYSSAHRDAPFCPKIKPWCQIIVTKVAARLVNELVGCQITIASPMHWPTNKRTWMKELAISGAQQKHKTFLREGAGAVETTSTLPYLEHNSDCITSRDQTIRIARLI